MAAAGPPRNGRRAAAAFGRVDPGQWRPVSLPADQQSLLERMDRALEALDPRLASMFAIFTELTSDEGPPHAERLAARQRPAGTWLTAPIRRARAMALVPIVVAASLMAAILAIGYTTSNWPACPAAAPRLQAQAGVVACGGHSSGEVPGR